ncbi:MAG: DUF4238 domain-containing protein [Cyclobacteriaceae bacterium]
MTISKRHHYLPQFYLRGFTNDQEEFFVFDKVSEEIRKSNPINSFFENHRNTAKVQEEKSALLEDMYAHFDSVTAPQLEKIRIATQDNFVLEPEILHRIKMFITQMYWRVPENDQEFEKVINDLSFSDAGFDFVDKVTGKSVATKELQEQMKDIDLFRKMYRVIIPLISAQEKYKSIDYENWRVYFRGNKFQLTSDNPLIIEKFVDFSSLNRELLFPLCSDKIFVHTIRPKPKNLPSIFLLHLDMLIIQQATRFVCCSDRFYLEYLVNNFYSFSKNYDFTEKMKESVFGYFA